VAALPIAPLPAPGETLSSWTQRLAAANHIPLKALFHSLGLTSRAHHSEIPHNFGISLTPTELGTIHDATGVDPALVEPLTFASLVGGPATGNDKSGRPVIQDARQFGLVNWLYLKGSHYCPDCLNESAGAWLLEWRLPWVFACVRHQRFLLETCPGCAQRADIGRADGRLSPAFASMIPKPGYCHNPSAHTRKDNQREPCHHPLFAEAVGESVPDALMEAQSTVHDAIATRDRQWWSDLRVLTVFPLVSCSPDSLARLAGRTPLGQTAMSDWTTSLTIRDAALASRRQTVAATGIDPRQATKNSTSRTPPTSPTLMAAATWIAVHALEEQATLEHLVHEARSDQTGITPTARLKQLGASEDLNARALRAHLGPQVAPYTNGLASRYPSAAIHDINWNPDNLPPYLWDDLYDEHIAKYLDRLPTQRATGRRFAVIALYRAATGTDWQSATQHFKDAVLRNPRLASNVLALAGQHLGDDGRLSLLATVADLAAVMGSEPRLATYPVLRQRATRVLAKAIPKDVYRKLLISETGHLITRPGRLRASVWAWADITMDDRRLAPAWGGTPSDNDLETYRRWVNAQSPGHLAATRTWALEGSSGA